MPRVLTIRAKWVFPGDQPPIPGGSVTVRGNRIVAVGRHASEPVTHDYPQSAVLPGLINPHVHLEFSGLTTPLGRPGTSLPDWIGAVVAWRRAQNEPAAIDPSGDGLHKAIAQGLAESQRCGVCAVGEIATHDMAASRYQAFAAQGVVYRELLGFHAARGRSAAETAARWLSAPAATASGLHVGLSPHAPYTVRWQLLEWTVRRAQQLQLPLAMHIAESREELELLATGGGTLRTRLERLGAWDDDPTARRARPLDYLQLLSQAPRVLVIHGNYLHIEDWRLLAQHAKHMTVVYCPRTHAYFQHRPYPLRALLAHGARVAIGTDSRASNPDLNLLADLRFAAQHHPHVDPAIILRAGTATAAQALGCDATVGTLTAGKQANLTVIPLNDAAATDPWTALFTSEQPPQFTLYRGQTRGRR